MHELGIVFHVIKSVEEIAQENELTKVSAVTTSIGAEIRHRAVLSHRLLALGGGPHRGFIRQ